MSVPGKKLIIFPYDWATAVSIIDEVTSEGPTDQNLLAAFQAGDAEAMGALYDRHAPAVTVYLLGMLGDRQEAEDVLQHVMVGFIRQAASLGAVLSVRAYLLAAAHNGVANVIRSRSRRDSLLHDYEVLVRGRDGQHAGPASNAETEEMRRQLNTALAQLPDDEREVVLLRTYAGLSFSETAEALGLPRSTAADRYQAAIAKLRGLIDNE